MGRRLSIGAGIVVALAALSLLLPYELVYDPWAWLVWGREVANLELSTVAGPSWKPLPVLIDVPLSLLGDAAPQAWLLIARSGWLAAPLLAGWLAARFVGAEVGRWRLVAAALAAGSVALTGDAFTPPLRQFTGGLSEPLLVALVLGAVATALDGRRVVALWLGVAASLLRPECWLFLAAWAVWEMRRDAGLRVHVLAAAFTIPLAWFVPDLLAAGNPLEGSETARSGPVELVEIPKVIGRALVAPLAAAWVGVALFLAQRRDEADRAPLALLAAAALWIALVAAMAVVGYAGLPRFLAPATAVVAIVGSVGIARAGARGFEWAPERPILAVVAVAAVALACSGFAVRVAHLPDDLRTVRAQTKSLDDLLELVENLGTDRLLACGGRVRVAQGPGAGPAHAATAVLAQTALPWWLGRPIEVVKVVRRPRYGIVLGTRRYGGPELGRAGAWRAMRLPC